MDKNNKNKSANRERDAEGRFVSQNQSKQSNSQNRSGSRKSGNDGRGRNASQQPRDEDGRFESKN